MSPTQSGGMSPTRSGGMSPGSPSGAALSDWELHNNIFVFFFAGHETSSTSLSMALYLLAHHPEHQQRARTEAKAVLGEVSDVQAPQPSALQHLHFCQAVLK